MTRASCKCDACKAACQTMPGYLGIDDIAAVEWDSIPVDKLAKSSGALVFHHGNMKRIGTIVPQQKSDGSCVFYRDGLCEIHRYAPFGCREFEVCDPDLDGVKQMKSNKEIYRIMLDQAEGGPYSLYRDLLPEATPVDDRRKAFRDRFTKLTEVEV